MENKKSDDIRIVVLQRGWVVLGRFHKDDEQCKITHGYVVRRWGTENGLGELAENGKLPNTILDRIPDCHFNKYTIVFSLLCNKEKWDELCI